MKYTDEQIEAIISTDKELLLLAGAGAGLGMGMAAGSVIGEISKGIYKILDPNHPTKSRKDSSQFMIFTDGNL